jgi:hypothetical protein
MRIALGIALLLLACGHKSTAPAQPGTNGSGTEMPAGHHEGEQTVPPELQKFHDVFAPLWHQTQGPDRMNATCSAVAELQADADAVAKATPPTTANADKWTEGTRALVAGVKDVADACAAKDMGKFETALMATHEALHALMGQAGMGDEEMHEMHH